MFIKNRSKKKYIFIGILLLLFASFIFPVNLIDQLNGECMMRHIRTQLAFGPRLPGSEASKLTAEYFKEKLTLYGWKVEFQEFEFDGISLRNVIAKNSPEPPQLIIGTHYDTRQYSDRDPDKEKQYLPVPGAIDGASGSAIILELGKHINKNDKSIWLVFFDGEDQGEIHGWQWSIGAQYFAQKLVDLPEKVIILDMLGDENLKVYKEKNSSLSLSDEIWGYAGELGYEDNFINIYKYSMLDDHTPFIDKGIPVALLIDFDYPYWHTTSDTIDKVSARNLEIVFEVMHKWINSQKN